MVLTNFYRRWTSGFDPQGARADCRSCISISTWMVMGTLCLAGTIPVAAFPDEDQEFASVTEGLNAITHGGCRES